MGDLKRPRRDKWPGVMVSDRINNCGTLPFNQTWDWHWSKRATSGRVAPWGQQKMETKNNGKGVECPQLRKDRPISTTSRNEINSRPGNETRGSCGVHTPVRREV